MLEDESRIGRIESEVREEANESGAEALLVCCHTLVTLMVFVGGYALD